MQTRSLLAVLAMAAPLALGACASDGGGGAAGGLAGSGAGSSSGTGGALASRTPPGSTTTVTSSQGARNLVGKSDSDIRSSLGTPAFQRTDGPAQVWQYRGSACMLDVFLYKEGGGFRVKHAELRRRGGAGLSDSACMSDAITGRARS
ncbi:MAG TPA: hypothetical protein VM325_16815 [Alphaproteobacteria bacterium]|nr:hypothetical protein [Alphaproteobacteria bacterium]